MEQQIRRRKRGINGNGLRTWALLLLTAGVIGRGLIQTHILGVGQLGTMQLLEVMNASQQAMTLASCSLVLQALEACAVPLYALMLTEGVQHTTDFKAYFKRIFGLALLCELPYNLAMNAKLFALTSRNPVFSLVMAMVMLYFYSRYQEDKFSAKLTKAGITLVTILWCEMLKIEFGSATVLMVAVLWWFRKNTLYRNFAGATAAIVCTIFSPFFLAAPMCFLVVHSYDGEKSTSSRRVCYLAYPCILMAAAITGFIL